MVSPQKTFDERKVSAFRKFCTDFFDEPNAPKDPLELARHGADKLKAKRDELKATITSSKYPFVSQLSGPIDLLDQVVGKPKDWYLTNFNLGGDLLDTKESIIDPVQAFLGGGQKTVYDDALALLATHSGNLGYLPSGGDASVRAALDDPNAFRGSKMAQLKLAADQLRAQIDPVVAANRAGVIKAIEGRKAEIEQSAFYAQATPDAQTRVLRHVDQIIARVHTQNQIALIREAGSSFEETVYPSLLDALAASQPGEGGGDDEAPPPPMHTVSVRTISAIGISGVLETEADIDRYLDALRSALVKTLNDGKRISL